MTWNEWNGMNDMEWTGMNGMMERNGTERNGMELNIIERNGMEWNEWNDRFLRATFVRYWKQGSPSSLDSLDNA